MADLILEFLRAERGNGAEADAAARLARIAERLSRQGASPGSRASWQCGPPSEG
jgi:hypothetical protein